MHKCFYALGFSYRKRELVRALFPNKEIKFRRKESSIPHGSVVIVWGSFQFETTKVSNIKIIRLEDGFIRSVGLGVDLVRPISWVADYSGIYYDSTQPSDLENILEYEDIDGDTLLRAEKLRKIILDKRITKYNVGELVDLECPRGRSKILVVGQVESDASLDRGGGTIRTNLSLVKNVKKRQPDAFLVYKPHPDVLSGIRAMGKGEFEIQNYCDKIVENASIDSLIDQVDQVHVMTSLAGFEALLRGKEVHCYGIPFYSGWGLTKDYQRVERRTKSRTLCELVAATLIIYPNYMSLKTGELITVEQAVDELGEIVSKATYSASPSFWLTLKRCILKWHLGILGKR